MDREKALEYIRNYYNQKINLEEFLIDYVTTRGKPLKGFSEFIQLMQFTGNLETIIDFALKWCIKEYEINTIWSITDNKKIFVTAY